MFWTSKQDLTFNFYNNHRNAVFHAYAGGGGCSNITYLVLTKDGLFTEVGRVVTNTYILLYKARARALSVTTSAIAHFKSDLFVWFYSDSIYIKVVRDSACFIKITLLYCLLAFTLLVVVVDVAASMQWKFCECV